MITWNIEHSNHYSRATAYYTAVNGNIAIVYRSI